MQKLSFNILKNIFLILIIIPVLGICQSFSVNDINDIKTAYSNSYVSNQDGILSDNAVNVINQKLTELEKQTTAQVAVVALKNTGDYSARDLSMELFDKWKVGQKGKDNGVIILLALDKREVFIRTGYGLEGAITDAKSTQIVNRYMSPYFREGDWDRGIIAGVDEVSSLIVKEHNGESTSSAFMIKDYSNHIFIYLGLSVLVLIIAIIFILNSTGKYSSNQKEEKIKSFNSSSFGWKIFFIFFPLNLLLLFILYKVFFKPLVRRKTVICNVCSNKMHVLSEKEEDGFLSKSQQLEEVLKSKDYDVWLCNNCGNKEIFSYNKFSTKYSECPHCHAKTMYMAEDRILRHATPMVDGTGKKIFVCQNCHNITEKQYIIPKTGVVVVGGGSGRGFGGGSFGGGSFGGGMSGGGGGGGRF